MPFAVFSTAGLLDLVNTHPPLGAVGGRPSQTSTTKRSRGPSTSDDPDCPPDVLRAKGIYRDIESYSGAINLDDDIEDDSGYATVHKDKDNQEGERSLSTIAAMRDLPLPSKTKIVGVMTNSMKL
ncbi:hypothetical protein BDK51DRAFT_45154 [Blyttiomyces helicus]|uniref:Uncharacterized protein n=1 Tax=Blyttiomyces helicus TaxID=388810 RepID=A0A4P9WAS2_9FUNG|nr:hypothetical protein BDK51DRAFT_45154 [Blyttiomyces helicus]|eukprot:RKO89701.1 hypothetical protein BDK51DRAFT_45154 [Blyttiomyces helicus]